MITLWIFLFWIIYMLVDKFLRSLKVDNFADKYVFITGCDTGFGRELAIRLDSMGFHVFAGCLTGEGEKSLSSVCSSRLNTVRLDVSKAESISAALQRVQQKLPSDKGIWSLVNNAGIGGNFSPIEMCSSEDFVKVFNVNFLGTAETTRQFLPLIRKSNGRVVNITSTSGRIALYGAPYSSSKYAIEALSDILRREVYDQGIKVSIIEPGGFSTPILNKIEDELLASREGASPDINSIYERFWTIWLPSINRYKQSNAPLTPVIDAYTHAIVAKYPRTRYVVGADARFILIPMSYLPDWIVDRILRIIMNLIRI